MPAARRRSTSSACTADTPVREADIGLLGRISQKVVAATLRQPGRGRVRQAAVRAGGAVGASPATARRRCSPTSATTSPVGPIVARPYRRTATVTVHAKEGAGRDRARRRQRAGQLRQLGPRLRADEDRRRDPARCRSAPASATSSASGLDDQRVRPRARGRRAAARHAAGRSRTTPAAR